MRRPIEAFLATEVAAGAVLGIAAILALGWANSPWRESYAQLLETPAGLRLGSLSYEQPLQFWIDEVLMTMFFFVVGLEIRREIARGELSDLRRAALPLAAALGGMVVPAVIYAAINAGRTSISGWGVPMATDIAFAVGALAVLGKRMPPALRVLLLALAVIDDVGAILVIGIFYSSNFHVAGLAIAAAGLGGIFGMQRIGVRNPWWYVLPGAIVWTGVHEAGVHATIAGVIVGLVTPARAWFGRNAFVDVVGDVVHEVRAAEPHDAGDADIRAHLDALATARREAVAPVDYLEHALHRVVAFGVMPVFALANAGVTIGSITIDPGSMPLIAGVVVGLVIGKPLGIVLASWIAVRARLAALPRGVTWRGIAVVGAVGGIGFTMSIFIAELAFTGADLPVAKLAVLAGSLLAGVVGLVLGRTLLPPNARVAAMAASESEAESSTSL